MLDGGRTAPLLLVESAFGEAYAATPATLVVIDDAPEVRGVASLPARAPAPTRTISSHTSCTRPARPARPRAWSSRTARSTAWFRQRPRATSAPAMDCLRVQPGLRRQHDGRVGTASHRRPHDLIDRATVLAAQVRADPRGAGGHRPVADHRALQPIAPRLEDAFRRLRILIIGGDVVDPRACSPRGLEPRHGRSTLVNTYGPTETTLFATSLRADRRARPGPQRSRSAAPIAITRIYLLDRHGQPGAAGRAGEMCIGGDGVAHRLPRPARADRRALRPRPVQRRARRAHVPHRRPGPLPARRQPRVPGPHRQPGEGARLPHRAGRDRGRAPAPARRAGRRHRRARRRQRGEAGRLLRRSARRARRRVGPPRRPGGSVAGVHGPAVFVRLDKLPRNRHRQGRIARRCRRPVR